MIEAALLLLGIATGATGAIGVVLLDATRAHRRTLEAGK